MTSDSTGAPAASEVRNKRLFSLCTYKLHALGHYVAAIARFGTTDSYSTQTVRIHLLFLILSQFNHQGELEHRRVKRFYARTNKRKTFTQQIAKQQRRERILRLIQERSNKTKNNVQSTAVPKPFEDIQSPAPSVPFEESDPLPKTFPELRYHMSNTTRLKDNIFRWVDFHEQNGDEAIKVRPLR